MTVPPFLGRNPARALLWFWAGIVGIGATGAAALQVMGPPPVPAPVAPASVPAAAQASDMIGIPPSGAPVWPATTAPASPEAGVAATTGSVPPAPRPTAPRAVGPRPVRITVVPPMPPELRRAHAPGPRVYARVELRAPHHNPTHDRVVTYSYAEAESQAAYSPAGPPPGYGYAPPYPPGYGWGYRQPRAYGRGQYYAYYPSY